MDEATLKPKQKQFVAAYLTSGSIEKSCKEIGITPPTAYNWLNAGLRGIIDDMQDRMFNERLDKQCLLLDKATERLEQLINKPEASPFIILNIWKALNDSIYKYKQCVDIDKKLEEIRDLFNQSQEES